MLFKKSTSSFLQYNQDEPVTLWVNKVGPYNNPQETYNYYSLPFCHPSGNAAHKWGGLGEVLGGNELIDSLIDIKFKSTYVYKDLFNFFNSQLPSYLNHKMYHSCLTESVERTAICELKLDEEKVKQFKDAIENSYWFEFFMGMHAHSLALQ